MQPKLSRYTSNHSTILHILVLPENDGKYTCNLYHIINKTSGQKELLGQQTTFVTHSTAEDESCPLAIVFENNTGYTRACHCEAKLYCPTGEVW
ncbi:hypothetical protein GCK32_011698 [Trichostrongylus colubriformis]|uniref:Uncharacterized protein n=1 Tax=Trichostrongylus colubriformis TaxID=6319 RepID=A0AAN8F6H1_TRICO